jgi:hypothetical protein
MSKIPKTTAQPKWISEHLPKELVESPVFRFRVPLQVLDYYYCSDCGNKFARKQECECGGTIKQRMKEVEVDITPDLDLDYDMLEEQMQDLPAQYSFWAAVYSEARCRAALVERRMKAARGEAINLVQRRAAKDKIRFTNEQVKSVVEAETVVKKADVALQEIQMKTGKLYHMLEAIKMKAELARSLAGFKRQEQERS